GDGCITWIDYLIFARYLARWENCGNMIPSILAADLNRDGKVTFADRMVLARSLSGWDGYRRYIDSMPSNMIN
ncbi:MAG: hypothetical protein II719_00245, partial [Clostridia bacterium]|nr:hypothetical protein [Clostridia bacterium]